MRFFKAMCIALSMYSKIPVPQFEWKEEDLRYSICFFPVIGLLVCAVMCALFKLAELTGIKSYMIISLALMVVPVIITGGIHVDGYMDVSDALSSYQSRERKLEILKDPHVGAFAVIKLLVLTALFLIGLIGCCAYNNEDSAAIVVLGLGMALSRALSGISVVSFKCAKNEGTLYAFAEGSDKKRCLLVLLKETGIIMIAMLVFGRLLGAAAIFASLSAFLYYYLKSKKEFGGITGDVAGWFVCICETAMALAISIAAHIFAMLL